MPAVRRAQALRVVGLAGLLALTPVVAACGGSSGGNKAAVSASVGTGGAKVSASVSGVPSVTGSTGPLQVGQNVTLSGTVDRVLIDGGYIFTMTAAGQSGPVAVGAFTGAQVTKGDSVTVTGTVADVDVQQLVQQFGSQLTPQAKTQLQQLNGAHIVNATNVSVGGASGSVTPSPSASS